MRLCVLEVFLWVSAGRKQFRNQSISVDSLDHHCALCWEVVDISSVTFKQRTGPKQKCRFLKNKRDLLNLLEKLNNMQTMGKHWGWVHQENEPQVVQSDSSETHEEITRWNKGKQDTELQTLTIINHQYYGLYGKCSKCKMCCIFYLSVGHDSFSCHSRKFRLMRVKGEGGPEFEA